MNTRGCETMREFYTILLCISTFVLVNNCVCRFLKNYLFLPESLLSLLFGIFIGRYFVTLPEHYSTIFLFNFSRIVLCIQTMNVSTSLPENYVVEKWQSLFVLVFVAGILECIMSVIVIYTLGTLNLVTSWSLSACLTPTDPILSSSIVKGKFAMEYVPERIRTLLTAESGINDGIGMFLLYIGISILHRNIREFFIDTLTVRVILSAAIGLIIGVISRQCLKFCYTHGLVGMESFLVHNIILTLFSLSLMEIVNGSELICIFFAGITFKFDEWFMLEIRNSHAQEITETVFSTSLFVFLGTRIDFSKVTFMEVFASLLIILIRRPITLLLIYKFIPELRSRKEAFFVGCFGPVGIGTLYYSLLADGILGTKTIDFAVVTVFLSVVIHGMAVPVIKIYKSLAGDDRLRY